MKFKGNTQQVLQFATLDGLTWDGEAYSRIVGE